MKEINDMMLRYFLKKDHEVTNPTEHDLDWMCKEKGGVRAGSLERKVVRRKKQFGRRT